VYLKQNGSWSLHYISRDYLGSITHVANSSGAVVQELSYDAWGRLRNPSNQAVYAPDTEPSLLLGRGYTGHEHLTQFGLVHMNARLYDPAVGRFLSPDPFVQAPNFSQNFNRYSYVLNNPVVYADPDGEAWYHWVLGALSIMDPISATTTATVAAGTVTVTVGATAAANVTAITGFSTTLTTLILPVQQTAGTLDFAVGLADGLFSNRWDRLKHWGLIELGFNLRIPGWEDTQSMLGNTASHTRNIFGYVDGVTINNLALVVNDVNPNAGRMWGFTLGSYVNSQNIDRNMTRHELGHTIQSRMLGPLYMTKVAVPSLLSNTFGSENYHDSSWYEVWASRLGGASQSPHEYRRNSF
jgi:RHS repeat-associated protein